MPQRDPHSSYDVLDPIYKKLAALQAQVDSLLNLSIPTAPSYDSANFPQDSVEGQVAVGANDNLFHFFVNGLWRTAGAGLTWAEASASTGPGSPQDGLLPHDAFNPHFLTYTYFTTNDEDGFEQDIVDNATRWGGILIKKQGVYLTLAAVRCSNNTSFGNNPVTTWVAGGWDSFYYNASQLEFHIDQTPQQGTFPAFAQIGSDHYAVWNVWDMDLIYYEPDSLPGAPGGYPDYHQYITFQDQSGTVKMGCQARLLTLRLGDALASTDPNYPL